MKENEYRGKRVDNGEWVEGFIIVNKNGSYWIKDTDYHVNDGCCDLIPCRVIPETVCQYTGLKDENGNKIWEGDIIRANYKYEGCSEFGVEPDQDCFCQGIVVYDEKESLFRPEDNRVRILSFIDVDDIVPLFYFDLEGGFEILGNIYNK